MNLLGSMVSSTTVVNDFNVSSLTVLLLALFFTIIYFVSDKHRHVGAIAFASWAISAMVTIGDDIEAWPQATLFMGMAMTIVIMMMMDHAGASKVDFWEMKRR